MDIEFDPAKNRVNLAKHGLPLSAGASIIENAIGEMVDDRFDYGEERFLAFGFNNGRLLVCAYTMRGEIARVISVRRATKGEYEQWL